MKFRILIIALCIIAAYSPTRGDEFDYQVITMFQEGVVEMPGGAESAEVSEVNFEPEIIKDILLAHTAEVISVAFPDFDLADTLIESPRFPGLFAKQGRLDLIYRIQLKEEALRDELNAALEELDEVYFSDKNGTGETCYEPNDTHFPEQWGMHSDDENPGLPDVDIDAPEAWDHTQGNSSTVIGIMDTGVYPVLDLQGRVSGEGPTFEDHGTFVAGIAAAEADNGVNNDEGIAGVTWNSQIYSKNIEGYDQVDIYNSVRDAVRNGGADVLNNSWGSLDFSNLVTQAFGFAHDWGVLIVAGTGNQGNETIFWPSALPWTFSVGAFNNQDGRSEFSGYGNGIDVVAPGGTTLGSSINEIISTGFGDTYYFNGGTSFAAPHVSGLVGLLDFYNQLPAFASNFKNVIIKTAHDMFTPGYDQHTGHGRINAGAALDYVSWPKEIFTCETDSDDPYIHAVVGPYTGIVAGCRDLPMSLYEVTRYEVWEDVFFGDCAEVSDFISGFTEFNEAPDVWGIDCLTNGWSDAIPINGIRYSKVVSADNSSATLATFVYEVREYFPPHHFIGWYPNTTDNVDFDYTIVVDATPQPPVNLTVTNSQNNHPKLQWQPGPSGGSNDVEGLAIYRKVETVDDDFVHIAFVYQATILEYEDLQYYIPPPLSSSSSQSPPIPLSQPSQPGEVPVPLVIENAHYTVTAYDYRGIESEMPTPVTIGVDVPCEYVVGDVNGSGHFNGSDITYGVAYFEGGGPPPVYECECTEGDIWYVSGDVNASCSYNGLDITYGVAYLKGGPALMPCPDCPPYGIGILSAGNNMNSFETIATEMNSEIIVEISRSDSSWREIIADIYLACDDSVAFINIPLQWESENIAAMEFQPGRAISGWEEVGTAFRNGQLLFSAWNDLGGEQNGNKDPIVSNGQEIYLGQFTFSARDTSDIRDFNLIQFDDPRIGSIMLGHPNGITFSVPNFTIRFRDNIINPKQIDGDLPLDYSLMQNYPNPFNAQTVFKYAMPQDSRVSLEIFDILGRNVEILVDEYQQAGYHQVTWEAKDRVSGTYFYILKVG
ncbi:MAG: S8 family peptidase, partial [Candidatus Zixiibacteriota bacterium]